MKTDRQDVVLLSFITIIGLFIRIAPATSVLFPLNDGGLFYKMILDLQENHFVLPLFTTYNNAGIPFAYPPFAFYAYGLVSSVGDIPLLKLMQLGPSIISTLSIPVFFLLAKELLGTKSQVFFSVLIFSLVPRAFDWLIMGGGMTRSLGFLFALLTIHQSILVFSKPTTKNVILMAVLSGFVILTHPEAAIHTVIASIIICFWKDRTLAGLIRSTAIAFGAALISSVWWLTILMRHGTAPFASVLSSANQDTYSIIARLIGLFRFDFTDEPYVTLTSVLGLIGIFFLLSKRAYALPIWFAVIQIVEPRGGALYLMIPISMFAGIALDQVILPLIRTPIDTTQRYSLLKKMNAERIFIGFIFLYGVLSATIVTGKITRELTLTSTDLKAFQWVRENIPPGSKLIVITQGLPFNDATSEWFPAITERTSVTTIFGYEWLEHDGFQGRIEAYKNLQRCAAQGILCLEQWTEETHLSYSYVYLRKPHQTANNPILLSEELKESTNYFMIYETEQIQIFHKK